MRTVDAQVHLWKAESKDWKWVPGIEKLMPPPVNQAGVDRAVVVPPSWPGDRNDYALDAARRYPNRHGAPEEPAGRGAVAHAAICP